MLNEGDKLKVLLHGIQIAEDRKVEGGLIPEGGGYYWLFTNGERETELCLTPEAMDAVIQLYTLMLRNQIAMELTWNIEEKEGAIIATADPTDSGAG